MLAALPVLSIVGFTAPCGLLPVLVVVGVLRRAGGCI
jgi:hypothetical protein